MNGADEVAHVIVEVSQEVAPVTTEGPETLVVATVEDAEEGLCHLHEAWSRARCRRNLLTDESGAPRLPRGVRARTYTDSSAGVSAWVEVSFTLWCFCSSVPGTELQVP